MGEFLGRLCIPPFNTLLLSSTKQPRCVYFAVKKIKMEGNYFWDEQSNEISKCRIRFHKENFCFHLQNISVLYLKGWQWLSGKVSGGRLCNTYDDSVVLHSIPWTTNYSRHDSSKSWVCGTSMLRRGNVCQHYSVPRRSLPR